MAASRDSQHPGEGPAGAGTPAPVAAKAAAINAAQARPLTWKTVVRRAVVVAVAGAAIYLALPSLIAVLAHWGNEAKFGMSFADREPLRHRYPHGPYSMLGPVEVTGAQPGDVIEVSITALRTIGWGWNSFPLGVGTLPHDFAEPYVHYFTFDDARTVAAYEHGISLPMAPFLGVVAAEQADSEPVSAIVSGPYGGNLVLRDRAGSLRAGQHGGQLPGHPVRQPDRLGLHLDPAQGGACDRTQEHLPRRAPGPDGRLAAARLMTLPAADQLAILEVITRADDAASRRDPDAYVALFAAEGPVTLHLTLIPTDTYDQTQPGPPVSGA